MRFLFFTYFLVLGLSFIFSSCSYKQNQLLFEQKNLIQDSTLQKNIAKVTNYRIKPQDILQIRDLQNNKSIIDLTPVTSTASFQGNTTKQEETYQVEDDGTVALTGLGHVQIAGLTRLEAMKHIEELYHKNFLKNPMIELKIINLKVTVLGEIKSQGNFPLVKDRTTLVEMIGEAGGLTNRANEKNVKIIRGEQNNLQVTQIDLSDIKSISDPRNILQSGDIIYIAENKHAVYADKNQNFVTTIQPGLLILSTAILIFTLIRR